jgi:hypothetical protein
MYNVLPGMRVHSCRRVYYLSKKLILTKRGFQVWFSSFQILVSPEPGLLPVKHFLKHGGQMKLCIIFQMAHFHAPRLEVAQDDAIRVDIACRKRPVPIACEEQL